MKGLHFMLFVRCSRIEMIIKWIHNFRHYIFLVLPQWWHTYCQMYPHRRSLSSHRLQSCRLPWYREPPPPSLLPCLPPCLPPSLPPSLPIITSVVTHILPDVSTQNITKLSSTPVLPLAVVQGAGCNMKVVSLSLGISSSTRSTGLLCEQNSHPQLWNIPQYYWVIIKVVRAQKAKVAFSKRGIIKGFIYILQTQPTGSRRLRVWIFKMIYRIFRNILLLHVSVSGYIHYGSCNLEYKIHSVHLIHLY